MESDTEPKKVELGILDLPTEIIISLLADLDIATLMRCKLVCRFLLNIIQETTILTYAIELAVSGQQDGVSSKLPVTEKLTLLRNRQSCWNVLKWSSQTQYPMQNHGGGLWELFGDVLAQHRHDKSFIFVQLPGYHRGIPERQWVVKPEVPDVRDFTMEPSQDLLVILETPRRTARRSGYHRIHLQKLSTGAKHPLASHSGVIEHFSSAPHTSFLIQVSSEYIGIFFNANLNFATNEFAVWEWKTGQRKLHLMGDEFRSSCFLSDKHILLLLASSSNADGGQTEVDLFVVDFEQEGSETKSLMDIQYGLRFALPRFKQSVVPFKFAVRSDPSPSWNPHPDIKAPFHVAHTAKIFIASLWIQEHFIHHLALVVPQSTLLSRLNLLGAMTNNPKLAWKDWGPTESRLMKLPMENRSFDIWACYVHGTKFVVPERSFRSRANSTTIHLLDFNQKALRNGVFRDDGLQTDVISDMDSSLIYYNSSLCVIASTIFRAGDLFREEVSTRLGYRWIAKPIALREGSNSLMCSEDSVILVQDEGDCSYHVYSF
ncbi:hypothetical protein BDP27DRAFT_1280739 [Rhodocollybia butyracea]|uniref:F-box domain-containing protein n=1 Tax=Rhodocollybia butyracea TaxID=206335 RepID=A0A9P5Q4J2_9AGAR|nr:hypothetical protein BDP27DRAFT_1280739 [Rhodocollybia butyracea]